MPMIFEELDYQNTPLGEISLRRRSEPRLDGEILYEVKLGDEFLMSSLFTQAEIQLAKIALGFLKAENLNVVVGGLGLGYTAAAVLEDDRVKTLEVIDIMKPVINWHQQRLVPLGETITSDSRCKLIHGDFFKLASVPDCGFTKANPAQLAHAVLLDIDHSPGHWLNQSNSGFYSVSALRTLASKLLPGGVFGLWSNEAEDLQFRHILDAVFASSRAYEIEFDNPYTHKQSSNTVYIASKRG